MAKALRTAAIVVGAVALVATGVGAFAAAGSALALAAGTVATIATVAGVAIAAATALVGAKPPPATLGGNPTKFKIDKEAGIPVVVGRTYVGGNVVHRAYYGTKNVYESWVTALSLGPVKSIGPLLIDKAAVAFSGAAAVGSYAGFMWLSTQLGACPEASVLASPVGAIPGWGGDARLSGVAADLWTLKWDAKGEKFPSGVPSRGRVVEGVLCYDPRADSTYPGGSGACRIDQPGTWVYSENPALHAISWAYGRYQNGVLVAGGGLPVSGIDLPPFVEWANTCDANGWKVGGVVYTSADNKWDVLRSIAQAGGGEVMPVGAQLSCTFAAPRVSIGSITSADISGDLDVPSTASARQRRNTVIPRVRLEEQGWEIVPLDPVTVPDYVALDGASRPREIDLPLVQSATQGAQLAMYQLLNDRELDGIVVPAKVYALGYRPGDLLTLDIPEANLIGRDVLVRMREIDGGTMGVALTCRSETPGKHDFALGRTGTPPRTPDLSNPGIDRTAPAAADWQAQGTTISSGSTSLPALVVTGQVDQRVVDAVVFDYRVYAAGQNPDAGWIGASLEPATVTRKEVTTVTPQTQYELGVRYRTRGALSARLILGPVTTGALSVPIDAVDGIDDLRTEIDNALDTIEDAAEAIRGISDDGTLTVDEKIRILIPADAKLEAAWQLLDGQAAGIANDAAVTSARGTAIGARQAWLTYRNGLSPAWNNKTLPTAVTRSTFNGKLGDYEWSLTNLAQALRDYGLRRTNAAFETVARLGSDGWLTAGSEKQQAEIEYQALVSRLAAVVNRWQGLDQPALSPATALPDAGFALYPEYGPATGRAASLGYYLEHINPSYLSRNTDTQVDPAEWSARWKTAYDKIAIAEAALIGIVSSAVQSAVDAIAVISADGKWSPYEKRSTLLQQQAELEANYALLNNAATAITGSAALDTARITVGNKRQIWLDFLATVPSWSNPDVETIVNRGEARSKVVAYGDALNALTEALRVYTDSKAVAALQQLDDIANDGKIAPQEKWHTVMLWRNLVNRYQRGVDRYYDLGLQGGRIQAVSDKQFAAYNALGPDGGAPASSLGKTLGSLTPQWDRGDVTTIVPDPAALKAKFEAASDAVDAFLIAMSAQPDADNTSSAIASGAADNTISNKVAASPKLSKLDSGGRATSSRINSIYALRGAQQVYVPTNGNGQGGVVAGQPGSPIWSYTDPAGGPTATIQIFAHKLIDDEGTLYFGGGFCFNVQQGTQYWVYEEGYGYSGGNPTYVATTNAEDLNAPNRRLVGATFTPRTQQVGAGGGTSGGGGGGGGIRERYYENQLTVQP